MDRLVCGDVGFGKTEVAVRAAFAVAVAGKQTLFLAPTTISPSSTGRCSGSVTALPVNVEVISRFRRPADVKRILADFEPGAWTS